MSPRHATHEVELRAVLTHAQRRRVLTALRRIGATSKGSVTIKDVYFCPKAVRTFKEIEMDEVGSFSLRLRKRTNENETVCDLNIKVITRHGDHHAWEEHESVIDSFDELYHILNTIGFKPFFTLKKIRRTYSRGRMTVVIEDIVGFGPIIEVEILTIHTQAEQAKRQIRGFLEMIGVNASQIVPKSVTNMLMRKKSRF